MIHKLEDKDGIMHRYFQNLYRAEQHERERLEDRENKKQELIQKTAARLDPIAQKMYLFLRSASTSFWGECGPANMSYDREKWREFDAWLKELEND